MDDCQEKNLSSFCVSDLCYAGLLWPWSIGTIVNEETQRKERSKQWLRPTRESKKVPVHSELEGRSSSQLEGDDPAGQPAAPGVGANLQASRSSWISHFHSRVSLTPLASLQDLDQWARAPLSTTKDKEGSLSSCISIAPRIVQNLNITRTKWTLKHLKNVSNMMKKVQTLS